MKKYSWKPLLIELINSSVSMYAAKCVVGFVIGYTLYKAIPQYEVYWTLLSILLVLTPEDKDARRLAVERMKANLIGSVTGLLLYVMHKPNLWMILIGVLTIIVVCHTLKLIAVARTAMATLIIVLVYEQETTSWLGAVERLVCVVSGCLIGLGITFSTTFVLEYVRRKLHSGSPAK